MTRHSLVSCSPTRRATALTGIADRLGIPAISCEHDAGLVDIDKQGDVVVPSPGCGLIDRHPPDSRKIGLCPGTIDVMVNDAPQPGVMFADQTGHGVDRHR